MTEIDFPPARAAARERLADFVPKAGRSYAENRNFDLPGHPHVSTLSPYIRHRILSEAEVIEAVLARWAPSTAEKFVQEVIWRSYFKGWLEHRPGIWSAYRQGVDRARDRLQTEAGLRDSWESACRGETGIEAFDHWARQLVDTGYLHNHARMWFASIWIFTLRLPWELGADFFLRHLFDGDPASNTLGWRWVAGLHTRGKNYVARPSNIAKYTDGRLKASDLAGSPEPLDGSPHPEPLPLRECGTPTRGVSTGLLITEDDLSPDHALGFADISSTFVWSGAADRSPYEVSRPVIAFTDSLIDDTLDSYGEKLGDFVRGRSHQNGGSLVEWAKGKALEQVVVPYLTVGPARDALAAPLENLRAEGISVVEVRRPYDDAVWPYATAGFFKVKKRIPDILDALGLRDAA